MARYLSEVEQDLVAHAEEDLELRRRRETYVSSAASGRFLDRYRVNVVVDMSDARGVPVVLEPNPTYGNLVGRVEHRVHFGSLVSDFTLIKAGALHRANGGYLVLEAVDVLRNPLAWEALKKALKSRSVRIEDPLEEWRMASTAGLAPEPIPLSVKVVLVGTAFIYYLLCAFDEDFRELFKVKVDFDDSMPRAPEFEQLYARFVAGACREENLPHFSSGGVAKLIEHCSRLVADQRRLTSRLGDIGDLIGNRSGSGRACASTSWSRPTMSSHAINQKIYRENLLEERTQRVIAEGVLLIAAEGRAEWAGERNGGYLARRPRLRPTVQDYRAYLRGHPRHGGHRTRSKAGRPDSLERRDDPRRQVSWPAATRVEQPSPCRRPSRSSSSTRR